MTNVNRVILVGNLTRDIELKSLPSGGSVAQIGLAVNRKWKDKDGEKKEEVTFVDCEAWGKTADVMAKYLAKGRPVFIEGRLKLDQWEDKDGGKRSKIKVVVESFQFIDSNKGGDEEARPASNSAADVARPRGGGMVPSDIPFGPRGIDGS